MNIYMVRSKEYGFESDVDMMLIVAPSEHVAKELTKSYIPESTVEFLAEVPDFSDLVEGQEIAKVYTHFKNKYIY